MRGVIVNQHVAAAIAETVEVEPPFAGMPPAARAFHAVVFFNCDEHCVWSGVGTITGISRRSHRLTTFYRAGQVYPVQLPNTGASFLCGFTYHYTPSLLKVPPCDRARGPFIIPVWFLHVYVGAEGPGLILA